MSEAGREPSRADARPVTLIEEIASAALRLAPGQSFFFAAGSMRARGVTTL